MTEFTKGKWRVISRLGGMYQVFSANDLSDYEYIADCFHSEPNARLIAAAPDMYNKLYDAFQLMKAKSCCEGDVFDSQAKSILKLLNRIHGKEENHE